MMTSNANISSQAIQTSLATIDKQIIKLNRLMSELLDLSRIDSGKLELKMQNFDLNDLVKETVDDIQQTTKHQILVNNNGRLQILRRQGPDRAGIAKSFDECSKIFTPKPIR